MGVLLAQLNMPRIGKNIHKAAPLMETEPYFPPHWKKKCFCQSRHLISLLSSSNLLTFQANLFLLCYLSFSQDLSLCRACLKPANVVIIKMAFKICLNKKDFSRIQYLKTIFFLIRITSPHLIRTHVGRIARWIAFLLLVQRPRVWF